MKHRGQTADVSPRNPMPFRKARRLERSSDAPRFARWPARLFCYDQVVHAVCAALVVSLSALADRPCRCTHHSCGSGDIVKHDGVGADARVVADPDAAQNLGAGAYVDMVADPRHIRIVSYAERHLLEDHAVYADFGPRDE